MLPPMLGRAKIGVGQLSKDSDDISAKAAAHDRQVPFFHLRRLPPAAAVGLLPGSPPKPPVGHVRARAVTSGARRKRHTSGRMKQMIVMDGILYAIGSVAGGLLTAWLTGVPLIAVPFFVFAVFCLYFLRDPNRDI